MLPSFPPKQVTSDFELVAVIAVGRRIVVLPPFVQPFESVTVTDSKGCTKGGSTTILRPTAITATSSKSDVTCFGGNDGSINATISGGVVPYTFSWSNSATTEDISGLISGQYILNLTDINTCN